MTPNIHFYDVETGYIHYVSEIIPGMECRVYDSVRSANDAHICLAEAIQWVPELNGVDYNAKVVAAQSVEKMALLEEAIRVSRNAFLFMERIMTRSPVRDTKAWQEEGKSRFQKKRKERRATWLARK